MLRAPAMDHPVRVWMPHQLLQEDSHRALDRACLWLRSVMCCLATVDKEQRNNSESVSLIGTFPENLGFEEQAVPFQTQTPPTFEVISYGQNSREMLGIMDSLRLRNAGGSREVHLIIHMRKYRTSVWKKPMCLSALDTHTLLTAPLHADPP